MNFQKNNQVLGDIIGNNPRQQPAAVDAEPRNPRISVRRSETNEAAAPLWFLAAAITLLISLTITRLMF
jgi:hypothetical protein